MEIETTAKRWGSSIGVILPKTLVEKEHIKENDKIVISVKKRHYAREFFGLLCNWKRPTNEIKKEMKHGW
jgi:antitoxin component of MazEF toxin-antitoxin module